jgi:drug/metabolite transporter (DMT)-like permease
MTAQDKKSETANRQFSVKKIIAFTMISVFWGISYMAIRLAIDTIPPLLMAGIRFSIAGILLVAWCILRYKSLPALSDWRQAAVPGILMFVLGNGNLTWAEQYVPSGLASLIIAMLAVWIVLIDWLIYNSRRPDITTGVAIVLGLAGVALLSLSGDEMLLPTEQSGISFLGGILILIFASVSWAGGSVYARYIHTNLPILYMIGLQILIGGIVLFAIGTWRGEWQEFSLNKITIQSYFAMFYLVIFASILAYSAYIWLMRVSSPAMVGTYAFFNPLVAVFLGWLLLKEPLTLQTGLAAALILSSIFIVNRKRRQNKSSLRSVT